MKKNKQPIVLVNIASEYRSSIEDLAIPPAGCLYVGDALKKVGYNVIIKHITPSEINFTAHQIIKLSPLFVGFSILTGSPIVHSVQLSKMIKERLPQTSVVWGGIHPSLMPLDCLKEPFVDYVIQGEGEITSQELAKALSQRESFRNILGLGWKKADGKLVINDRRPLMKNIDKFKQDWSLVNIQNYVKTSFSGEKYFSFITSRGCPHKCGFCYNLAFNEQRWRPHSVQFVVDEMVQIRNQTGVDCFTFCDDNFLANKKRALKILEKLKEENIHVAWIEVRLDAIDDTILSELSKYNVKTLFVGWESGSNQTLSRIDKGFNTDLILNGFKLASKYSFEIDASAIVGFPFETEEQWQKTFDMVLKIDALNPGRNKFNLGVYIPYPGTPIAKIALERGFKFPSNIGDWNSFDILKGEMKLPWISPNRVKQISIMDRYAKMLFIASNPNWLASFVRKVFSIAARFRFKHRFFKYPIEAVFYDFIIRMYLTFRISQNRKQNSNVTKTNSN